jgi:ribosome biogenesis GTPase
MRADRALVPCTVRGRLLDARGRLGNAVVVGDVMDFEFHGGQGAVTRVHERRTVFHRRASGERAVEQVVATNLDHLMVVASADAPRFRAGFVDRVLAQAQQCGIPAGVALNKADLVGEDELAALAAPYVGAGYTVLTFSAKRGDGVEELRQACRGRRTLFMGQSGVGKSTVLNAISPGLGLKVGEVNPKTLKGRHTTSTAWLMWVPPDLEVIDTPGMRGFGLWGVDAAHLDALFPELASRLEDCHYASCRHHHEPGCAVREAVERGAVPRARYQSFLKLYQELAHPRRRSHR